MTASPEDRPDEVADPVSNPTKKTTARKAPAKKAASDRTPPRSADDRAAATGEVVIEPITRPAGSASGTKSTGSAARTAAARNTAAVKGASAAKKSTARTASARASRTTSAAARAASTRTAAESSAAGGATGAAAAALPDTTPSTTAAKTTAAKATAAKTTAAKTTAAKTTAAKSTATKSAAAKSAAAKKTTAAKTAAAKAATERNAAAKSAAAKSTARTAAARTAAARTAAAKAAAAKAETLKTEEAAHAAAPLSAEGESPDSVDSAATLVAHDASAVDTDEAPVIAEGTDDSPSIVETSADDDASATPVLGDEEPMTEAPSAEDSGSDISETAVDGSSQPQAQAEAEAEAEAGTAEPELDVQSPADETVEEIVSRADEADAVTSAVDEPDATDAAASASDTEAIRIRGLVKSFGDHTAVDGIDLTVPAGSFYGIVGPNGAGKTTTLSIVAGLLRADRGEIVICGIDQRAKPLAAKRMMGVLPDRLRTFDRLTGRQLLHYYGLLRGLASGVIEKRVGDLARAFDLGDALNRVVSDYSAGMTKKIMLAGAMIHSPRVLVLDEPFEAVDPVSSAVILDILRAYVAHGGTVILSSHGMDLVERVCSRVAIIVGGEVLAEGTIDEVRAGQTLEARFVELSGGAGEVEGLEWLHTFSD